MTPIDETDVLARFNRRLAGIETDVKDGSASGIPRPTTVTRPIGWRSRPTGPRIVLPLLVAVALVAAIAVIRPIATGPGPSAAPVGSQPAVDASPSSPAELGQGPARLRIQGYALLVPQPEPSGIRIAPTLMPTLHFRVAVTSPADAKTVTIPADDTWGELDLTPGPYEVDASERTEIVDVDNGRNIIGVPGGPCAIRLDLAPGTTTMLTLTDVYGQACAFAQRLMVPPPPSSPSPAFESVSPAPSQLPKSPTSKARAIDLADEEAPAGASYESISVGFFPFQLTPPWASLDQLIPPAHLVWAAHFASATTGCPGQDTCGETVVYLDYLSGAFLVSVRVPTAP